MLFNVCIPPQGTHRRDPRVRHRRRRARRRRDRTSHRPRAPRSHTARHPRARHCARHAHGSMQPLSCVRRQHRSTSCSRRSTSRRSMWTPARASRRSKARKMRIASTPATTRSGEALAPVLGDGAADGDRLQRRLQRPLPGVRRGAPRGPRLRRSADRRPLGEARPSQGAVADGNWRPALPHGNWPLGRPLVDCPDPERRPPLPPLPKRKYPKARQGKRRSHLALKPVGLTPLPAVPHRSPAAHRLPHLRLLQRRRRRRRQERRRPAE